MVAEPGDPPWKVCPPISAVKNKPLPNKYNRGHGNATPQRSTFQSIGTGQPAQPSGHAQHRSARAGSRARLRGDREPHHREPAGPGDRIGAHDPADPGRLVAIGPGLARHRRRVPAPAPSGHPDLVRPDVFQRRRHQPIYLLLHRAHRGRRGGAAHAPHLGRDRHRPHRLQHAAVLLPAPSPLLTPCNGAPK